MTTPLNQKPRIGWLWLLLILALAPLSALAQEALVPAAETPAVATAAAGGNGPWLLIAAASVLVMFIGLAARELGFSHSRNSVNVVMKALLTLAISVIGWLFLGFGLMYVHAGDSFFAEGAFWLKTMDENPGFWSFWLFQGVIVAVASLICSGAVGERVRFGGFLVAIAIFSALVFPMLAHFAWGSQADAFGFESAAGWLEIAGFHDFGGSIVIHGIGGAFALAGAIALGPRMGRFAEDGSSRLLPGHSLPLAAFGVFLLWIGSFGIVLGQVLIRGIELESAGRLVVNLCVSAGFGAIVTAGFTWCFRARPDAASTLNGALVGLIAASAGADLLSPAVAAAIGACAGVLMLLTTSFFEKRGIDDLIGAGPVHLVGGIVGALAVAAADPSLFGIQAAGALTLCLISFCLGFLVFKSLDLSLGVRASEEEEAAGLDFTQHAAAAYPEFDGNEQ
ncbi:MAG: Amt family ammonium transporter [Verrucomicrobiales bacterium]